MHFGEPLPEDRLLALLRPGEGIDTVMSADAYGAGEADTLLGRAIEGVDRDSFCLIGAIGHDFYEGEREGAKGFPRFTDPHLRDEDQYGDYIRMAAERSLERLGADAFDLLLLHNPDRTGYRSEAVWEGMKALREAGPYAPAGRGTWSSQRLHARLDRLHRALRRAARLGDDHPQPDGAVAGRDGARRRRGQQREADHAGRGLRRPVPRRRAPGTHVRRVRPPQVPTGRVGRDGRGEAGADAPLRREATG